MNETIRVLLADDHAIFRQGLRALLQAQGFDVVGEAGNGVEAVELVRMLDPDVAILDLRMPGMGGIDAAREIQKLAPRTQTVLLTMYEDESHALEALRAGMHGYVLKRQSAEELAHTVTEVAHGAIHLSAVVSQATVDAYATGTPARDEPLTAREQQVLQMIADGRTTREIAGSLRLSAKTVESHRSRIMRKLGLHRTAELIRYAVRRQLITP